MSIFKKREKSNEINENDSTFVKLWKNPRTHALMVLGIYVIFFLFVLVIINAGSSSNQNNDLKKVKEIKKYFTNLEGKKIKHNYIIKTRANKYLFQGEKTEDGLIGSLTDGTNIKNIKIENNECLIITKNDDNTYEINDEEKCPDDINYDYFDYISIYRIIENLKYKINNKSYIIEINDDDSVELSVNKNMITKIIINNKSSNYEIEYLIEEIDM